MVMQSFNNFIHSIKSGLYHRRASVFFVLLTIILHFLFFQSTNLTTWSTNTPLQQDKTIQIRLKTLPDKTKQDSVPITNIKNTSEPAINKIPKPSSKIVHHQKIEAITDLSTPVSSMDEIAITPPLPINQELAKEPEQTEELTLRILESADLTLAINRTSVNGSNQQGVGKLAWHVDDEKYALTIEVGLSMVVTTLNLYKIKSEGALSSYGLSPRITSESRLARAETATHFDYEQNTISFSASSKVVPMEIGAQDKASVLMQLASIGNSDASQFSIGRELLVQVAEEKEATIFNFFVIGEEEIDSVLDAETNKINTIHISRPPKPGTYNSRLDIWLAPSLGWYPVQIHNTESNGTVTTQKVTRIIKIN
jgi:hypothetical protein